MAFDLQAFYSVETGSTAAWLDLAQAARRRGEVTTALALVDEADTRPAAPRHHRQRCLPVRSRGRHLQRCLPVPSRGLGI